MGCKSRRAAASACSLHCLAHVGRYPQQKASNTHGRQYPHLLAAAEDIPVIQSVVGTKDAASLAVSQFNPQSGAAYYLYAFTNTYRSPDGNDQQVSPTSGNGSAADPFTFTWSYTAAGTPPAQRWFMVVVDSDGPGPGSELMASIMFGPVLLGESLA